MTTLTWFINQQSGKYFLLDPLKGTLQCVTDKEYFVLDRYSHLMGVTTVRAIKLPDYETVKKFQKALKKLDLSSVKGDVADHLVNSYPEYFI